MRIRSSALFALPVVAAATATLYAPSPANATEDVYQDEAVFAEGGETTTSGDKYILDQPLPEPLPQEGGGGGYPYPLNPNFSTLWIHGRWTNQWAGTVDNHNDWSYWKRAPIGMEGGQNPRAINWIAGWNDNTSPSNSIGANNHTIRNALDCYCTGPRWCAVAAHSAGGAQIAYALANHGWSQRIIRTGAPASNGVCNYANGSGNTQTGWNIKFVAVAASAEGGSELSGYGNPFTGEPLVNDLTVSNMRSLYNHNQTATETLHLFVGGNGNGWSLDLPGEDDGAVAYHSTGGMSQAGDYCKPSVWLCDGLEYGYNPSSNGVQKWHGRKLEYRDDDQYYSHSAEWFAGPTARMKPFMYAHAW